jgi:antitoxin ChpS
MLAVPPAILDLLHLEAGGVVDIAIDGTRLVIEPRARPRYTLDELLEQCDAGAPLTDEDRSWNELAPLGREL